MAQALLAGADVLKMSLRYWWEKSVYIFLGHSVHLRSEFNWWPSYRHHYSQLSAINVIIVASVQILRWQYLWYYCVLWHRNRLTHSLEPSSYWETESHLTGQENRLPVWNWNVHCRVHNSSSLGLFLSQTYPVRCLVSYCFKICLITSIVVPFMPRYFVCFLPFISYLKSYTPSSFSSYRRIRPISRP